VLKKRRESRKPKPATEPRAMHTSMLSSNDVSEHEWIVDSGATQHMTSRRELFFKLSSCDRTVSYADDRSASIDGYGSVMSDSVITTSH
jgi:hypothetical protein